ncbi:MAG: hypothetical protein BroJett003_12010 [Planctomycetota bacterium]|nr:MAG: hypothetical protein BroJett003_12010 [Planctomycetota bacterium]
MIELVLKAVAAPMLLGAALLAATHRLARQDDNNARLKRGGAAWGVALAAAFAVSVFVQEGAPRWPPAARWHGTVYAIVTAALIGLATSLPKNTLLSSSMTAAGAAIAAAGFVSLPGVDTVLWRGLLGAVVAVLALVLGVASRRNVGWVWPVGGAVIFTVLSGLFMQSHFAKAAVACGAVAACFGSGGVLMLTRLAGGFSVTGAVTAATATAVLSLTGYAYDPSGPLRWTWALPTVSLLGFALAAGGRASKPGLPRKLIGLAWIVVCCGAAAGLDFRARMSAKDKAADSVYSPY